MQKIIIIEDDTVIRDELSFLLGNEGYQVFSVIDFSEIPNQVLTSNADLILLDVGLPGRDGFSLCAEIRKLTPVPIIFVTSRDSSMDELKALSLGGDDYITKPYNIPILLAHIKAVLRRSNGTPEPDTLHVNGLSLNLLKGTAGYNGRQVDLTRNEIQILSYLMERPGEIASRMDLIEALWNNQIYIDDNTLSVNITRLRGKLAALLLPDYIKTRRGLGYQI